MKTGIVTFHEANNYGAVLQAYALQENLHNEGADAEFIRLSEHASASVPAPAPPRPASPDLEARLKKYPRLALKRDEMAEHREKRARLFDAFREEYLRLSRPYASHERSALGAAYDRFVVGSDQVWNYEIFGKDQRYFLPFAPDGKKTAYAASFGLSGLPEQLHGYYAKHLRSFASISVREKSGQALVKSLIGRDVPLCLDPTLLPGREMWTAFASRGRETGPRILLYLIDSDMELIAFAEKLAAARNLPIKLITASLQARLGARHWSDTGVVDFVSQFMQAEEVLTDSFHGLAFSLIFRKNFHISSLVTQTPRYGRLHTLLELTGLQDRVGVVAKKSPIDWLRVEKRLEAERATSLSFLRENCL